VRRRRLATNALVLAGYSGVSFALFGWRLLPHPGRLVLGQGGDPAIYIWSMAWWPHAIGAWTNPLVSHAVYAPTGVNIAWTPSAPGLALLFSPLTVVAGPVVSFNVAALLMPALGAWTTYLLCRYLTRSLWASLVAGYLFGFSTAALREVLPGNLNLAGVFLFPLIALFVLRYLRGELDARGVVLRLAPALALQLLISTEFAAELVFAIVICLLLAFAFVADVRRRIRSFVLPLLAAYALSALIVAPFTYYLLFHFASATTVTDIELWGTDLLGFVVPAFVNGLGGTDLVPTHLLARVPSHSAYLGLPTMLVILVYAVQRWRSPGARFLLSAFVVAVVATMGATFSVYGHTLFRLRWWHALTHVPGLNDALPFRLAVFSALAAAVVVALWVAPRRDWPTRILVPGLCVLAIAPAFWRTTNPHFEPIHPQRLAFFTSGTYKRCLGKDPTVALFPFLGPGLLWQAESHFRFRLAADGLQPFPRYHPLNSFDKDPIVYNLVFADQKPDMPTLLAFAGKHGVVRFLSVPSGGYPTRQQMAAFGRTGLTGGMLVSPACGAAALTSRNLARYVAKYGNPPESRPSIAWCKGDQFFTLPEGIEPTGDQAGATHAIYVQGTGLTCGQPPPGYEHHGFASQGVEPGIYPYYRPP